MRIIVCVLYMCIDGAGRVVYKYMGVLARNIKMQIPENP